MRSIIALGALVVLMLPATASSPRQPQPPQPPQWGAPPPAKVVIHRHHRVPKAVEAKPPSDISRLESELAAVRRELAEVREQLRGQTASFPAFSPVRFNPVRLNELTEAQPKVASLPDLRLPSQPPANPEPPSAAIMVPDAVEEVRAAIATARAYLIRTATPGFTMVRQGVALAIERLHPDFTIKLASAVRQARTAGLARAGVFSAYRPPAFGIGGFGDKFNSLHSYGLAADVTGVGAAGSSQARLWQRIVALNGLFLPYGANNRAEFNHTQLIPTKVAARAWRRTITGREPKDLRQMWLASGVKSNIPEPSPTSSATLLPENKWPR